MDTLIASTRQKRRPSFQTTTVQSGSSYVSALTGSHLKPKTPQVPDFATIGGTNFRNFKSKKNQPDFDNRSASPQVYVDSEKPKILIERLFEEQNMHRVNQLLARESPF